MSVTETDVIIVGAGMSGLSAALTLADINPQIRFVVLEGSGRVGGRTYTNPNHGHLDLGGQYLAPPGMQTYSWSLVERFQLETFKTHIPQAPTINSVYEPANGPPQMFQGSFPITPPVVAAVQQIEWLVLMLKAHLGAPWNALNATALDGISVDAWGNQNIADPLTRELLTVAVRCAYSVEPDEISMLHFLHYGATCGSFRAYEDVVDGGDAVRFRFGTKSLADALVNAIGTTKIVHGARVRQISQNATGVTVAVETSTGTVDWQGKRVIIAMSPSATSNINFTPSLPQARATLVAGMPMAHTIKGFAIFNNPWWRAASFSGYVLSAKGPAHWVMDNCFEDANGAISHPSLMTFIVGQEAINLGGSANKAQRKNLVLDQFARAFGVGRSAVDNELVDYIDADWGEDPWARGCPANCFNPGVLTALDANGNVVGQALASPVGRIHWAGAETATDWMGGYMNGAIQAGMRAAGEVVNALP